MPYRGAFSAAPLDVRHLYGASGTPAGQVRKQVAALRVAVVYELPPSVGQRYLRKDRTASVSLRAAIVSTTLQSHYATVPMACQEKPARPCVCSATDPRLRRNCLCIVDTLVDAGTPFGLIMLKVHREGVGVCGVFPRDVAATKVEQVSTYARQHQHPLACVMEEN